MKERAMTIQPDLTNSARQALAKPNQQASGATWLSVGGILAGLAAASCCVLPFLLFTAGIGGAWIANLTALEPYQPIFAAVALGFVGYGTYLVYWKPKAACAADSYCARPASSRMAKIGLWSAAALVVIAIGFPYLARAYLGS
jgi:mercuric ion transport protein